MIFNQTNFTKDLRDLFCNAVTKIFGDSTAFLDFLENEEYSDKYDCYLDCNGENYIINRETGEYINWYKLDHIGRSINISIFRLNTTIPKWINEFLFEFKKSGNDRIPKDVFDKVSDDLISRQAVLEKAINVPIAKVVTEDEVICRKVVFVDDIENLPPVTPQQTGYCKNCKYFEYDYVTNVDGIPLILAHEVCKRWSDPIGCKTKEDGYCFLFEPSESEEV